MQYMSKCVTVLSTEVAYKMNDKSKSVKFADITGSKSNNKTTKIQ